MNHWYAFEGSIVLFDRYRLKKLDICPDPLFEWGSQLLKGIERGPIQFSAPIHYLNEDCPDPFLIDQLVSQKV